MNLRNVMLLVVVLATGALAFGFGGAAHRASAAELWGCPPQDQLGFALGQSDTTSDPIFCSYPAVAGEDPFDFFCTYSKTDGHLVTDNDAGLCQPTAVDLGPGGGTTATSLTTTASGGVTVGGGGMLSDQATLSGGSSPTGTITFKLYGPGDPTCASGAVFTSNVTVASGNGSYTSGTFTPLAAGAYVWSASYTGDSNNDPSSDTCGATGSETVTVAKASPSLTTTASSGITLGSGTVSDSATLSGGYNPTGSITFALYGPGDPTCSSPPAYSSAPAPVSGNGTYSSGTFSPTLAGSYVWSASHGGDSNNGLAPDVCGGVGSETVTVTPVGDTLSAGTLTLGNGVEGSTAATASFAFTDTNTAATASAFTATIDWGDGHSTTGSVAGSNGSFTASGSHVYAEESGYTVKVAVNGPSSSSTNKSGQLTVSDAPLTAGTLTLTGGFEGTTNSTASFGFTDGNTSAPLSDFATTIDWGDGHTTNGMVSGSGGSYTVTGSHLYADEGMFTVKVTVNDVGGSTTNKSGQLTVADAPLTGLGNQLPSNGIEGLVPSNIEFDFQDAFLAAPLSDFSSTITWGDGSPATTGLIVPFGGGLFGVRDSHQYAMEGTYTVTVKVVDVGGSTVTMTGQVTVGDAALTASCTAPATSLQAFSGPVASVVDPNSNSTAAELGATIDWGDGHTSSGTVSGSAIHFSVAGTHTYATTGPFTVQTTVTDPGGSKASTSCAVLVYAFAPGGGAFTIGDRNAILTHPVVFWSKTWKAQNSPSSALKIPAKFYGYGQSPAVPSCGVGFTTPLGAKAPPPPAAPLPAYMGVWVASAVSKSGKNAVGFTKGIVVVKTDPGYNGTVNHQGTGTIVAQVCSSA